MSRIRTIESKILVNYEENLNNYDELYLPNCYEIIDSFCNENFSIKKIVAPKLTIITYLNKQLYVDIFNFINLQELIIPNIKHIKCPKLYLKHIKCCELSDNYNIPYGININGETIYSTDSNYDKNIKYFNKNIYSYKDKSEFKNCTVYPDIDNSILINCNITFYNFIYNIYNDYNNIYYNCKIPYLDITISENKIICNPLSDSLLFEYFKDINEEGLTNDEIKNILQKYCYNNINNIEFEIKDKNKSIIHDLQYLLCDSLLNLFKI